MKRSSIINHEGVRCMNKKYFISLIGASALVLSQLTVGMGTANAVTACVQLDSFADRLEITYDTVTGNLYGPWDTGLGLTKMIGANAVVGGEVAAAAVTASWRINFGAKTVAVWVWDGVIAPFPLANDSFTYTGSTCNFPVAGASDKPFIFGQ